MGWDCSPVRNELAKWASPLCAGGLQGVGVCGGVALANQCPLGHRGWLDAPEALPLHRGRSTRQELQPTQATAPLRLLCRDQ